MKKQLLPFLFAIVASVGTMFANGTKIGDLYYNLNATDQTAEVTSGTCLTTANIPASVTYGGTTYSVTSIGYLAFYGCSSLTSVTIPNSVTSIGTYAFSYCDGLTSVTIPNSVTSIGEGAFYDCRGLTSVTIPNSVTSIGEEAFRGCRGLTSVTIPNSVTSIGERAFDGVYNIIYSGTATGSPWGAMCVNGYVDGYLVYSDATKTILVGCSPAATGEIVIPNSVTSIGERAFYNCSGLTSVTIPNSVTSIGYHAFYVCSGLTSVTLNSNTIVGKDYEYNSNIKSIFGGQVTEYILGDEITSIGNSAFSGCGSLTSVTIPNSVTSIGYAAFWNCSGLTSVTIPNSVTSIGEEAFYGCSSLTSVTIGNSVTSIGNSAFSECSSLASVTIPNSVTSIGSGAFGYCSSLTSVTIPNSVTSIGNGAFYGCSGLTSVTIPNSVTSIGYRAFAYCSGLTSVTIPNSVTSIKEEAFSGCSGLTSVTIPNSVTSIGEGAFEGVYNIIYSGTATGSPWGAMCVNGYIDGYLVYSDATKTILVGCLPAATGEIVIPNSVTSIGNNAFYQCSGLTSVTIPNSVTSIGNYAFKGCSSLTSIYVPCGEMARFKQMLNNDSRVKYEPVPYTITITAENGSVAYPQTTCDDMLLNATPDYGYHFVKWSDGNTDNPRTFVLTQDTTFAAEFAVDQSGVCGDDNLLTWTFDDESKTLAISGEGTLNSNYTFGVEAPTQTERLIIAEGVTSVGNNAFKDMSSTITSLALPSTVTEIGDYAFAGMNNRKFNTLVLPNTIIRIGAHAFDGASYLQTIHFGSTLEEIGDYAFNGCTRVKQMTCLAEITPNVGTDGLTSINSLAELYVPNEYLFDYQIDSNWSRFVLKPYGATETTVTDNDVAVVADDNTATFTWPTSNTADSYTIDITKDGVLFCQLTFNANGQLTGIAFAPGRNGQSMAPAATLTTSGMQFTVTGLNSGTNYAFNLTVKSGSTVVASYTGAFATTGGVPTSTDVLQSDHAPRKFMRDNQVLILRDGKTYTVQGQQLQ